MNEKQRNSREICYAKILFLEDNIPAYVKDISVTGCRIDIPSDISWEIGQRKKIIIIPEDELAISPIKGTVEIRWLKKAELFFKCGMQVVSVRDAESKENYIKLLKYYKTNVG